MKVLIIQQKMIGDVLASTILCQLVKEKIPGSVVHFVINRHTEAVVIHNPFVDKIVYFTEEYRKSKRAFYCFLKEIAREKYDVVIDAYCKLESNAITLFSGAKTKISYRKWYSRFIYTHAFDYSKNVETKIGLAIENRLLLLTPILSSEKIEPVQPKIYLTEKEIEKARTYLERGGINFETPLIMIGILGSSENKTYPLQYMARLIDEIVKTREVTLLFNYIPSQQEEADRLHSLCSKETRKSIKFDLFANSLRTFLALLHFCDALISNEGGAVNMAKAMDLPTFSIFSPWVSKEAWDTYKNEHDLTVHLNDYKPEKFQGKLKGELKNNALELYHHFEPKLLQDKLVGFLNHLPTT